MGIQIQSRASTQPSLGHLVRLACLRHAASVHPEPGSNSQKKINNFNYSISYNFLATQIDILLSFQRTFSFFASFFLKCINNITDIFDNVNYFFLLFLIFYQNKKTV